MLQTELTQITANVGNAICSSVHIPDTSIEELKSYIEVFGKYRKLPLQRFSFPF
jgi:hypothetical protein